MTSGEAMAELYQAGVHPDRAIRAVARAITDGSARTYSADARFAIVQVFGFFSIITQVIPPAEPVPASLLLFTSEITAGESNNNIPESPYRSQVIPPPVSDGVAGSSWALAWRLS